ncbi:TetR/AcrR family transcriptional regulator [Ktedonosporobacter rubrisoli]|uniref:TetR/AcrR family transcriptional regulator n=1 Tax=Ktedonosporobacter rubrisoli TaxID=2509675 RepID=A0A4P6JQ49_KTERU|nr:TetR/AcrR family transcriptional regulator [Ktedonosporobacter rubrisoli]QBD77373.1 TetR/AcrR family transcriptional regulator [Ktedonosporobacter rubrisoli]
MHSKHDLPDASSSGRMNQKIRTRQAIIEACRGLIRSGSAVSIPEVARVALVSEATVYRYFPDLPSLVNTAIVSLWPSPAEALAPIAHSTDPVERIAFAAEIFLRRVQAYQGAVRAMIAATITQPEGPATRPKLRFDWIDEALAPAEAMLAQTDAEAFTQLKRDLAVVVSAEALFTLTDLCGLSPDEAISTAARLARTITAAALCDGSPTLR